MAIGQRSSFPTRSTGEGITSGQNERVRKGTGKNKKEAEKTRKEGIKQTAGPLTPWTVCKNKQT